MKRIVIGNTRMMKESSMLKRYIVLFVLIAFAGLGIIWALQNVLPDNLSSAIEAISKDGSLNLGFFKIDSMEELHHLGMLDLLRMAFSNKMMMLICGCFIIESISRLYKNGFWEYLLMKNADKTKMYLGTLLSVYLISFLLVLLYCLAVMVAGAVMFELSPITGAEIGRIILFLLFQLIIMLGVVSFFVQLIHLARNMGSAFIATVIVVLGIPETLSIVSGIFHVDLIKYLWIGGNNEYLLTLGENHFFLVLCVAVLYIVFCNVTGVLFFRATDLK